ncbi:MAG: hypothetical protein Q4A75_07760 [Peptostreptococcaceae bacterium]|nr:hypothetical protein [Peptostreptococcaceae bacterium]
MKRYHFVSALCLALMLSATSMSYAGTMVRPKPYSAPASVVKQEVKIEPIAQKELVALLSQSLANAKILDEVLLFEGYTLGKNSIRKGMEFDQPKMYYEVVDGLRNTPEQLAKIADSTYPAAKAAEVKKALTSHLIRQDGKIYAYKGMANPEPRPETFWDIPSAKVIYQTADTLAVLADVRYLAKDPSDPNKRIKANDLVFEGKLVFQKENGKWLLTSGTGDTNLPYSGLSAMSDQNGVSYTQQQILDFAGKKENGYTLSEPIHDLIPVFDPFLITNGSGFDAPFDSYFVLSLNKIREGQLEDIYRIYVPQGLNKKILIPKKDAKGMIDLNYQKLVTKDDPSTLFAYRYYNSEQDINKVRYDMRDTKYWAMEEIGSVQISDDFNEGIVILPKYYGTTIEVYQKVGKTEKKIDLGDLDSGLFLQTKDASKGTLRIVIRYGGDEISFSPQIGKDKKMVAPKRSVELPLHKRSKSN